MASTGESQNGSVPGPFTTSLTGEHALFRSFCWKNEDHGGNQVTINWMPGLLRSAQVRILQVHNQYREPGGEDRVVGAEYELLKSAGHEVFTHRVTNPTSGVQAAGMLLFSANNPGAAQAVRRLAAEFRPDVAHVHNTWFSLSPSVLGALHRIGVPVVVTLHNYRIMCVNSLLFRDGRPCEDCVGSHPWHGVLHRCYRDSALAFSRGGWGRHYQSSVFRLVAARRPLSRPIAVLAERFAAAGIPDNRMTTVSNFVDDPGPRLSSPADSNMVLFVGRLSPEKGADLLLSAWPGSGRLGAGSRRRRPAAVGTRTSGRILSALPRLPLAGRGSKPHAALASIGLSVSCI